MHTIMLQIVNKAVIYLFILMILNPWVSTNMGSDFVESKQFSTVLSYVNVR